MLLGVPWVPSLTDLDPFWEHFGSEMVAHRLDFEGPGLSFGSILDVF